MGTVSLKIGEGTAKFRHGGCCAGTPVLSLIIVISVFITNSLALYSFYISRQLNGASNPSAAAPEYSRPSRAREAAAHIRSRIAAAQRQLKETKERLKAERGLEPPTSRTGEVRAYVEPRKLPLGRHPSLGIAEIAASVGHACHAELLGRFMNYSAGGLCPDDGHVAQKLMLRGCEPLPRRRCLALSPPECREPPPYPASLWSAFSDRTVRWSQYTCKSFACLNARKRAGRVFEDCADCFDIGGGGPERRRWVTARDRHDFLMDDVLGSNPGGVRIGVDIGGGGGTFAARMAERNVTMATTTLDLNGPFNEFVALRGLVPLHVTVGQRFPFFDNTMDIVHTMHVLSHWMPLETLDFLLFDIDRILRPGGLFWLDRFFCAEDELQRIYVPLIEKFSYKKLKWVTGRKADSVGRLRGEVYLSALLQKPARR